MAWGILANAAATALAAVAYGVAAIAARRRQNRVTAASALPLLFATVSLYLLVAALRQLAAWATEIDAGWQDADRALYLTVIVPAAFVIVPHVHVVSLVAWGRPRRSMGLALAFAAVVLVGLAFAYVGGISGPQVSEYGTDWTLNSDVTKLVLLLCIMLPGLVGSAGLLAMAGRLDANGKRRVTLVGWAMLVYFAVFTLDAFGLTGLSLLGARLATAGTGVLAWLAYRNPRHPHGYIPPPESPDEMMYTR